MKNEKGGFVMAVFTALKRETTENPGSGTIIRDVIVDPAVFGGANKMFARITLKPGCAVPVHKHVGNNETYYLLEGEGEYTDEDKKIPVKAGMVTFCADGGTHGLKNTGKENLVFIALIANTIA
jgi:mannose-6-phosphate isomerase-like protein (cupin superfamily)